MIKPIIVFTCCECGEPYDNRQEAGACHFAEVAESDGARCGFCTAWFTDHADVAMCSCAEAIAEYKNQHANIVRLPVVLQNSQGETLHTTAGFAMNDSNADSIQGLFADSDLTIMVEGYKIEASEVGEDGYMTVWLGRVN